MLIRIADQQGDLPDNKLPQSTGQGNLFELVDFPSGGVSDGDKGDIVVSGGGLTWLIDTAAVTLAKMANIATATILGRVTAGTGVPEALTGTQATTLLDLFTNTLKGLVPGSGGGTANFLRADGTWASPPGTGALNNGTATLDFGAAPADTASVTVVGQAWVGAASRIRAWFMRDSTADNGVDEHEEASANCPLVVGSLVVGDAFTIYANTIEALGIGQFTVHWEGA